MRYSNCKEINKIVHKLVKLHCCTVKIGGKHSKVVDPKTGRLLVISSTPSDRNSRYAFLRDIKKYFNIVLT